MPRSQRRRHSGSVPGYWFVAVSAAVHLGLASLMLFSPRLASVAKQDATPPALEFRLVQYEGAGPTAPPPPGPAPPNAAPPASVQPPPKTPQPEEPRTAAASAASSVTKAPAVPTPAATPPEPAAPPAPQVNLGGTDSLSSLIATGERIVPPAIDSTVHNREPVYPREAVRLGQQGAVTLVVHIAPDGSVRSVDIPETSGFPMLDAAARDAVSSWHFRPAIREGQGATSEFPVRIQFHLY